MACLVRFALPWQLMRSSLVLFFVLQITGLSAQVTPRIRNFQPSNYGGQNQNWALAQAEAGWLYAGNNGGLLEFDGSRWRSYALPENQTVRAVATGPQKQVFCGGFAEFGYWQPDSTGRLRYRSLSKEVENEQVFKEEIWHILATEQFVLFQSFSTIYKYDFKKVTVLKPPNSIMFAREVQDRILVPVIGEGLFELLPDNTFRFVNGTEPLADKIVQFLVPNGNGKIWAGTTSHGIFEISTGHCSPWRSPLNTIFKKYQLNKALALSSGGWAIGTLLNGLYLLDDRENLRFQLNRENGLQNNTVLALDEDQYGQLWIGLDRGIDLVLLTAPLTFFTDLSGKVGAVYSAAKWKDRLYIGTNQGVFSQTETGFQLLDGTQGQVWQLEVFSNQLLCGHNSGTFLIDGLQAKVLSNITGGWCTVPVPGNPELLLQSTYTGLVVFSRSGSGAWQLKHRVAGFNEPLKKILFDAAGTIWGSHPNKGLFRLRLSPDLKQVQEYKIFTKDDGLPSDFALDLSVIAGMPIVNAQFAPLQILDSAGSVFFKALVPPSQRQKWLPGAGSDYFMVDSSGITLHTSQKEVSLPLSLIPGYEHVAALDKDSYLFCLENGFAQLDKRQLLEYPAKPPPVYIRWVETNSGQMLPQQGEIQLAYRQNSLRFHFASPKFDQQSLFSWRLDGLSKDWSPWQNSPEKEFTNLPSGKYTFRVRTSINGQEAILPFEVQPPWYRSTWAMVGYGLMALLSFLVLEKISQTRLKRQRLHLEAEKEQELTRQRLNSEREKLALEVENKTRELSNAALSLIRKNEAFQHLRDELLKAGNDTRALQKLTRQIDRHLEGDHEWEIFEASFNQVHDNFFKRLLLEFQELTPGDLRLAAYLKLNLSSKEIAPLLNISLRGVENKRYRLRKKLGLLEEANLTEFILGY